MTNYELITKATPRDLAKFLDGFDGDKIGDIYCRNCPNREDGSCPFDVSGSCPVDDEEAIMWWLNQPIKEKENKK